MRARVYSHELLWHVGNGCQRRKNRSIYLKQENTKKNILLAVRVKKRKFTIFFPRLAVCRAQRRFSYLYGKK